jgi:hypothetical protein
MASKHGVRKMASVGLRHSCKSEHPNTTLRVIAVPRLTASNIISTSFFGLPTTTTISVACLPPILEEVEPHAHVRASTYTQ